VIDRELIELLAAQQVCCCVIGAAALAKHGWARYSADIDLLTMNPAVLDSAFWPAERHVVVRQGDADDPLAGVARWPADVPHDVIVGRGAIMRLAVDTAVFDSTLGCAVATPQALVLLKLEAGGAQDKYDIVGLVNARRAIDGASWLQGVPSMLDVASARARRVWQELAPSLGLAGAE
jgi:hypothetical protein